MSLAPLTPAPHVVPANRLAFTAPVREAGGAAHWVTLKAEDSEEGTCHVMIGAGGDIQAGPRALLGHHIGAVASHPSVSKAEHHPAGHEPPGARDHPHYAEAEPKAPAKGEGDQAATRAGKPYARLHGADQGTRAQQIGKALSAAQGAAQGARAASGHDKVADAAVAHQQAQAELAAHRAAHDRNPNPWAPHLSPPVGDAKDRELQEKATRAHLAHQAAQAQQQGQAQAEQQEGQRAHEKEMLRLKQAGGERREAPEQPKPELKPLGGAPQRAEAGQPVVHSVGKAGETEEEREERLLAEHKEHKARFDQIFRGAHTDAGYKERRALVDRMNDIGGEVQDIRDKRQGQQPPQAPAAAQQRLSTPKPPERPKTVPAARAPRASAADKQAALEHVNRELGDSDVHAPTHKDITRRITSGELPPSQVRPAVDAAYEVAGTPPSEWGKFSDSLHHLHAQKAQNADRLSEMQGHLKEHQRTPKSRQVWPAHGERESRLAGSVESLQDRQERIKDAIARHGKSKVRESDPPTRTAGPLRFSAPVAAP